MQTIAQGNPFAGAVTADRAGSMRSLWLFLYGRDRSRS